MALITKIKTVYLEVIAALGFTPENSANKGQPNGYAGLDAGGRVPAAQLPSYVDDVQEYANLAAFPNPGQAGIIYLALDTNIIYRWSGSTYIEISGGDVAWADITGKPTFGTMSGQNANNVSITGGSVNVTSSVIGNLTIATNEITSTEASDDILITPTGIGALKVGSRLTLTGQANFGALDPVGTYLANNAEFVLNGAVPAWRYLLNGTATKAEFNNGAAFELSTAVSGNAGNSISLWNKIFSINNQGSVQTGNWAAGVIGSDYGGTGVDNNGNTLTITANATISGTNTGDQTNISGNAGTATKLQTARTINGAAFDGTANITITSPWSSVTGTPTTISGYGITDGLALTGGTLTGQLISTLSNNTGTGQGQIYLNGATGNRIDFNINGVAGPSFTTRSAGTKIVLYPAVSASTSDYALGIENNTLWSSVPFSVAQFKWYAGTTSVATLSGSGVLTASSFVGSLNGNANTATTLQTARNINGAAFNGSADITVFDNTKLPLSGGNITGNLGIGATNPLVKLKIESSGSSFTSPVQNDTPSMDLHNTNNASSSAHSTLTLRTTGTGGGNPFVSMDVAGVDGWSFGIDNADSRKFKIANWWASVSTNTHFTIQTNGNVGIGLTSITDKLAVNGVTYSNAFKTAAADTPIITKGWDPFTSGAKNGFGRWGLFMEPSRIGIGYPSSTGQDPRVFRYNADSTIANEYTIVHTGNLASTISNSTKFVYTLPDTGGTARWVKIGNWANTSQNGQKLSITINASAGYNASIYQNQQTEVFFKTSNSGDFQTGTGGNFFADGYYTVNGFQTLSPSIIRVVQLSNTSYDFYIFMAGFSGGSFYEVSESNGTWTNIATFTNPTGNSIDLPVFGEIRKRSVIGDGSAQITLDNINLFIQNNVSGKWLYMRAATPTNLNASVVRLYTLFGTPGGWTGTATNLASNGSFILGDASNHFTGLGLLDGVITDNNVDRVYRFTWQQITQTRQVLLLEAVH